MIDKSPIMAMTTRSSIKVKDLFFIYRVPHRASEGSEGGKEDAVLFDGTKVKMKTQSSSPTRAKREERLDNVEIRSLRTVYELDVEI
ncbi:MAG: hypothetical protein Q7K33_03300 [Candidatus Berkelbacteria bacterium]|nr:hypothetical protein [Candidatus Berkelbacteria bacterium]